MDKERYMIDGVDRLLKKFNKYPNSTLFTVEEIIEISNKVYDEIIKEDNQNLGGQEMTVLQFLSIFFTIGAFISLIVWILCFIYSIKSYESAPMCISISSYVFLLFCMCGLLVRLFMI